MSERARTVATSIRPRNEGAVVLVLNTPRTRALMGLHMLRAFARPPRVKRDATEAQIVASVAMGALMAVEAGDISDAADVEARRLYTRVLRACEKVMGRDVTLGDVSGDPRPRAPVIDLAGWRAWREKGVPAEKLRAHVEDLHVASTGGAR